LSQIKTGSANLQIALGSFFLNLSVGLLDKATSELAKALVANVSEFVAWASDHEAIYRSFQAIGNALKSDSASIVVPAVKENQVLHDKLLLFISNEVPGFEKLHECSNYIYEMLI
jgi:phospholipase A-2-activating protein